jgi:hypothetical protein
MMILRPGKRSCSAAKLQFAKGSRDSSAVVITCQANAGGRDSAAACVLVHSMQAATLHHHIHLTAYGLVILPDLQEALLCR